MFQADGLHAVEGSALTAGVLLILIFLPLISGVATGYATSAGASEDFQACFSSCSFYFCSKAF